MELSGKVIFIISYETWGPMHMSKHHYAIELARAGNKVFFINGADLQKRLKRGQIIVEPSEFPNLDVVQHRLLAPYFLKYKVRSLFDFLSSIHIKRIIDRVGQYPDVVWSFDTGNIFPLKHFRRSGLRILMPVDGPFNHIDEQNSAEGADVIISVTKRILDVFSKRNVPKLLVNHGVADVFLQQSDRRSGDGKIRVGYSGSLVRNDLDIETFLALIRKYPEVEFEFWGENDFKKSTIHLPQDIQEQTLAFIEELKALRNVVLHGPVDSSELAKGLSRMDLLLICYKIRNDQNHHKVLEYLGSGNVIVSNFLSSYADAPSHLLEMSNNPDGNHQLPQIFDDVITNLDKHNAVDRRQMRKEYARQFSYKSNVRRISEFISNSRRN